MRNSICAAGLCALACFMATGCAGQTDIVKLYDDLASNSKTYQRILVLDISSDSRRQKMFERRIVDELLRERTEAIASFPTLAASDGVLQEEIDALSKKFAADAILVTHIAGIDTRVDIDHGKEEAVTGCRCGSPTDYSLYDQKLLKEADTAVLAHTVIIVSNLYDTASKKRVWTVQSRCFDKASMSEVLQDESHAIVRQLKIDNLIR